MYSLKTTLVSLLVAFIKGNSKTNKEEKEKVAARKLKLSKSFKEEQNFH